MNRLIFFSLFLVSIQTINFYLLGLYYPVFINLGAIFSFIICLVMAALGAPVISRFFFLAIAVVSLVHHHLYFGYASGFWLFLLTVSQACFILFPQMKMRRLLILAAVVTASVVLLVVLSISIPPLYGDMSPDLTRLFFRTNVIRSPILFMLMAYFLVAENRKAEAELWFAARKSTEAAEAKSFFLSNISHELRTPMNAIKGFADILLEATNSIEDPKKREQFSAHLSQIRISSANLTSIIDDILDFARIETDRIMFRSKDFDIRELAKNVLLTAQFYRHKHKDIEADTEFSPDLPVVIKGDSARLSQVLLNLVGNAMKFTHSGFVKLRLKVQEQTETSYYIAFEIEDTGIGIPGEKLPYLFDSFSQVSRETSIRYGGTGLGLAITKNLVEMQGGTLAVMSSPGKGSLFTVNLWFEKGDVETSVVGKQKRDLRRSKILVAEDNEVNQILINTLLESWNADIELVENGVLAFGLAQQKNYDLILMDLQMPFMDGIEATENIRALDDKKKAGVPIVALTADVLSETRKKVFASGMNDIVTKPINQAELYAALRKALALMDND